MSAAGWLAPVTGLAAIALGVLGACNSGMGACPAKETIVAGAGCDDDDLQCAYDLPSPSPACDGTNAVIASSCTCTKGIWACPDPVDCDAGVPAPEDDAAAADESATDDDASPDAGGDV